MRRNPRLKILILERNERFTRRVGEATVEVSAYFLGHVLGLGDLDPSLYPHDLMSADLPTGVRRLPLALEPGAVAGFTVDVPRRGPLRFRDGEHRRLHRLIDGESQREHAAPLT
jgi:hypothetical protein